MAWTVSFLDERVEAEMEEQPKDIRARFDRMRQLIMEHGPARLPPKYVKHISDKVWELRMTGRDGIARAFYVTAIGQRGDRARFHDAENAATRNQAGLEAGQGDHMSKASTKARHPRRSCGSSSPWRRPSHVGAAIPNM